MLRARAARLVIVVVVLGGILVAGAVALASQSRFTSPEVEPAGVGQIMTEDQAASLAEEAEADHVITYSESVSLADVRERGLFPFQWPWFSDSIATPADAIAAAPELRRALEAVPALDGVKLMSTEEVFVNGSDHLQIQNAWLKVDDTQMIRIDSQILPEGASIEREDRWEPVVSIPVGEAMSYSKHGGVYTTLVVGDRSINVDLQATRQEHVFVFDEMELVEIGSAIIAALDG